MVQRASEVTASLVHCPHLVFDLQRSGAEDCADNVSDIAHMIIIVGNVFIDVLFYFYVLLHRWERGSRVCRCWSR